ncbi:MAG: ferritin family protein [Pseudomonadota bacterium]
MVKIDIDTIFLKAIEKEEKSSKFYSDLSEKSKDESLKIFFKELSQDELSHKNYLENLRKNPRLITRINENYDDIISIIDSSPPEFNPNMNIMDAFKLAINKEEEAALLYNSLVSRVDDPEAVKIIKYLANMEMGHRSKLEGILLTFK